VKRLQVPGRRPVVAVISLALFACCASLAAAEEVTRDSYREAVEPICKKDAKANERIFAGVRAMVHHKEFRSAAARFTKAAQALERAISELRKVPPPPADQARVGKWLEDVELEAKLFERVAGKLRAGDARGAERMVAQLSHQAVVANAQVIPLEFHYCELQPSRYT
jgi:hypothetical protein